MKKMNMKGLAALGLALALAGSTITAAAAETEASAAEEEAGTEEASTEEVSAAAQEEAGTDETSGVSQEENGLTDLAQAFAADLIAGDYDKLKTDYPYVDEMKKAVDNGQLEQSMAPAIAASGELGSIMPAWISDSTVQYTNVQVPCDFSVQPWNMVISFDAQGKIAGIHTGLYKEENAGPVTPEGVKETEMSLKIRDGWELPGTFTQPENQDEYAVVVFVHGSGSSDRNETVGKLKPFQDLAWGLAQQGIASYRYDKISYVYGEELAKDKDFTVYDETVNDAVSAVEMVRSLKGVTKVYVAGHSQGGMMMPAIAEASAPDGCIMMAAPARSFTDTLSRQCEFMESLNQEPTDEDKAAYENTRKEVERLKNWKSLGEDETVMGLYPAYIECILEYDNVKEAENMTMPVLVLQGEEDYQVTMDDYKIWEDGFKDKENWTFKSFPGLTHMFMPGSYENGPADYTGEKHIPENVTDTIADFIQN